VPWSDLHREPDGLALRWRVEHHDQPPRSGDCEDGRGEPVQDVSFICVIRAMLCEVRTERDRIPKEPT
jgi:hypothetical protein